MLSIKNNEYDGRKRILSTKAVFLFSIWLLLFTSGCEEESAPIEIRTGIDVYNNMEMTMLDAVGLTDLTGYTYEYVEIISLIDNIIVLDYTINRGNCDSKMNKPKKLKFGNSFRIINPGCRVREMQVETNEGTWTFSFN